MPRKTKSAHSALINSVIALHALSGHVQGVPVHYRPRKLANTDRPFLVSPPDLFLKRALNQRPKPDTGLRQMAAKGGEDIGAKPPPRPFPRPLAVLSSTFI